jgi:hypothetical protein
MGAVTLSYPSVGGMLSIEFEMKSFNWERLIGLTALEMGGRSCAFNFDTDDNEEECDRCWSIFEVGWRNEIGFAAIEREDGK